MTFIATGQLRKQTEALEKQAGKYDRLTASLEETESWLKRQKFKDVEEFQHILAVQREALELQRKEMFLLAGSLERICDKCETTEQKIADYREQKSDVSDFIEAIDISKIPELLNLYSDMKLK